MEAMTEGVVVSSMTGEFLVWNSAARHLILQGPLGVGVDQWSESYGLFDEKGERLLETRELPLVRATRGERVEDFRITVRLVRDGKKVENKISVTASPVVDDRGRQTAAVAVIRDYTKLEQQRETICRAETELARAQKLAALGTLTGGIAHDFNNQLTIISGFCQRLREMESDASKSRMLDLVLSAASNAASLSSKLLAFGRKQELDFQLLSVNAQIRNVHSLLVSSFSPRWEIQLNLSESLPSVFVDPSQIENVVMNLLLNARDAMENGGIIQIETSLVSEDVPREESGLPQTLPMGDYVCISCEDSGMGMSPETQERIFDPFFTTKTQGKGNGLGLSMSHGIVRQHRGDIVVSSEWGKGTCFKIFLPVGETIKRPQADRELRENFSAHSCL